MPRIRRRKHHAQVPGMHRAVPRLFATRCCCAAAAAPGGARQRAAPGAPPIPTEDLGGGTAKLVGRT